MRRDGAAYPVLVPDLARAVFAVAQFPAQVGGSQISGLLFAELHCFCSRKVPVWRVVGTTLWSTAPYTTSLKRRYSTTLMFYLTHRR